MSLTLLDSHNLLDDAIITDMPVGARVPHADRLIADPNALAPWRPSAAAVPDIAALVGVAKTFGSGAQATTAIADVTLSVGHGEFVAIVGASGCGKSTVLNLLAELDAPSVGTVQVSAQRRSLMFQEAALYPWLTAAENIELALRLIGVKKRERCERARELLAQVHLAGWADKRPHELSGGMRQRVAIARSLARDPDLLLLDEPFGALDTVTKGLLQDELEAVRADRGFAAVLVTHDVHEAVRLGDRVVVMGGQPGRIAEIYERSSHDAGAVVAEITERLRDEVRRRETDRDTDRNTDRYVTRSELGGSR